MFTKARSRNVVLVLLSGGAAAMLGCSQTDGSGLGLQSPRPDADPRMRSWVHPSVCRSRPHPTPRAHRRPARPATRSGGRFARTGRHALRRGRAAAASLRRLPHLRPGRPGRLGLGAGRVAHDRRRHRRARRPGRLADDRPGGGGGRHAAEGRAPDRRRGDALRSWIGDLRRPQPAQSDSDVLDASRRIRSTCAADRRTIATSAWPTSSARDDPTRRWRRPVESAFVINSLSRRGHRRPAHHRPDESIFRIAWPISAGTRPSGTR